MFNNITERESTDFSFNGFYRGEVVDVDDPLEAGRVRIRVFSVFDEMQPEFLPWATYADPFMGGYGDNGSLIVPELGSHVWLFFENGDHRHPVYFAGAPAIDNNTPDAPSESRTEGEYPHNKVIKSRSGITIEIDDTDGAVRFKVSHPSGTNHEIDNDGNINLTVSSDGSISIDGEFSLNIGGDANITIGGNAEVSVAGNTDVNSGGQVRITGTQINLN